MKIAILGYSGSGKSTLARELGALYGLPVLHLDSVRFLPGWQIRDREEAQGMVRAFLDAHAEWVIDGNYRRFAQEERLEQADLIVLMLFPRMVSLFRCWKRYRKYKHTTREDMSPGCNEKLDAEFVRWILWEGRTRSIRAHYRRIAKQYAEKTVILRSQRQIDRFVRSCRDSRPPEQNAG